MKVLVLVARHLFVPILLLMVPACVPMVTHMVDSPPMEGLVLDGRTGEPLANVQVIAHPRDLEPGPRTLTAANGTFSLPERSRLRARMAMVGMATELVPVEARLHENHVGYGGAGKAMAQATPAAMAHPVILMIPDAGEQTLGEGCVLKGQDAYAVQLLRTLPELMEQTWFQTRFTNTSEGGNGLGRLFEETLSHLLAGIRAQCNSTEWQAVKGLRKDLELFRKELYSDWR